MREPEQQSRYDHRDGHDDGNVPPAPSGPVPDRERRAFQDWRALLRGRRRSGHAPPRAAFRRLVGAEWRLAVRNPAGLVWGVGLPLLLLILFASLPGTTKPDKDFGGLSFFQIYLPVLVGIAILIVVIIGAFYFYNRSKNDDLQTSAVTSAAKSVSDGAQKVGDSAEKAADSLSNN